MATQETAITRHLWLCREDDGLILSGEEFAERVLGIDDIYTSNPLPGFEIRLAEVLPS